MNRILLIEDDESISSAVALNLRSVGYDCRVFADGLEAVQALREDNGYDLALLDIMLPGMDGFQLLEHMQCYHIPVIYMTARTDWESEVRGLREGAEDYIVKPFQMAALLVRIEKVLLRTGKLDKIYRFGDITLDGENRVVTQAGETVELTPLEFDVLKVLMKNKNRTVSRNQILDEIWGQEFFGEVHTVDVRISKIRKKLGIEIRAVSKTGYRLEERL